MKKLLSTMLWVILISTINLAQSYDRNILIEAFTNSHCPLCPAAYSTIESYLANGQNSSQVRYIYYHMSFPYPDDQLNQANKEDASARNNFYGPYSSTPIVFFDGSNKGNSYNQWESYIDERISEKSPVSISLSGEIDGLDFMLNAEVNMETSLVSGNLVIQMVAVENVHYEGRNGIDNHTNVMRKILGNPSGQAITISSNQTKSISGSLESNWNPTNSGFVVFVQNVDTKEVYQSEYISYIDLAVTDIEDNASVPIEFKLNQNYPNPFNPSTTIQYSIPNVGNENFHSLHAVLKVYDLIGREVATLVNREQSSGKYTVQFDANALPSGIYIYTLSVGKFSSSRKMVFLK